MNLNQITEYSGGCHCKKVRWKVLAPKELSVWKCNCSICVMKQFHQFVVQKENFTLICGEDCITVYKFNTGKALHKFCKHCGVQSFYHTRSDPNGIGINIYCLDNFKDLNFKYVEFDGENYEKALEELNSKDSY